MIASAVKAALAAVPWAQTWVAGAGCRGAYTMTCLAWTALECRPSAARVCGPQGAEKATQVRCFARSTLLAKLLKRCSTYYPVCAKILIPKAPTVKRVEVVFEPALRCYDLSQIMQALRYIRHCSNELQLAQATWTQQHRCRNHLFDTCRRVTDQTTSTTNTERWVGRV